VSDLCVIPIVEGDGEEAAMPILLRRVWTELIGGQHAEVLKPIRRPSSELKSEDGLQKAVTLGSRRLNSKKKDGVPSLVLVVIDADDECPAKKCPEMGAWLAKSHGHLDVCCVMAVQEYETWFVASAESLTNYLNIGTADIPPNPEESGSKKKWVSDRYNGTKYSETRDQPAMTAKMDLALCRRRSPSFDKLCRELEKRRTAASSEEEKS
jgi:hypothetical protein